MHQETSKQVAFQVALLARGSDRVCLLNRTGQRASEGIASSEKGLPRVFAIFAQTCIENGHAAMRCCAVSGAARQSGQTRSCGMRRRRRLSAVRHFPGSRIQANVLARGAALAEQMIALSLVGMAPWNILWYAEVAEYLPSAVHLHRMPSWTPSRSVIAAAASQSSQSWCSIVAFGFGFTYLNHALPSRAVRSVSRRPLQCAKSSGHRSAGLHPCAQCERQKLAFLPSPMTISVDALKIPSAAGSCGSTNSRQGLESPIQLF